MISKTLTGLINLLDFFIPPAETDLGGLDRKRRLASGCFIAGFGTLIFTIFFPSHVSSVLWGILCGILFLGTPFLLRFFPLSNVDLIAGIQIVVAQFGHLASNGGYSAIHRVGLTISPMFAFYIGGKPAGLLSSGASICYLFLFWFAAEDLPPDEAPPTHWVLHIVLVAIVGYSYEVTQTESLRILRQTLKQVDSLNRQMLFSTFKQKVVAVAASNNQFESQGPADSLPMPMDSRAQDNATISNSNKKAADSEQTSTLTRRVSPTTPRERIIFDPLSKTS